MKITNKNKNQSALVVYSFMATISLWASTGNVTTSPTATDKVNVIVAKDDTVTFTVNPGVDTISNASGIFQNGSNAGPVNFSGSIPISFGTAAEGLDNVCDLTFTTKGTLGEPCSSPAHAKLHVFVPKPTVLDTSGNPITPEPQLWYFNGENPSNYKTSLTYTLVKPPASATYTWAATAGSDKITITPQGTGLSAIIKSTKASAGENDVTIQISTAGRVVATKNLTVYAPSALVRLDNNDKADPTYAYESDIHYRIKDQFTNTLPSNVELNEKFTAAPTSDVTGTMNWRASTNGGATEPPSDWYDMIQGETSDKTPTPLAPGGGAAWNPVNHWPGTWQVGSTTIGNGTKLITITWQKYQGQARHITVSTP
jgi:hypothetical protein